MTSTFTAAASSGVWAAGAQLQAWLGHPLLLAARRRIPARRADLGVRQRLGPARRRSSRVGCCWRPDSASHTVSLVKQFVNPTKTLLADSQGNAASACPAGNWLLGYGGLPNFTEFDASGARAARRDARQERAGLQDLSVAMERRSRRAPPSLVVQPDGAGTLTVAASWNGATEVASWRVLAGASPSVAGAGRERAQERLSDDASRSRRRPRTCRAGAQRLRRRDRDCRRR